MREKTIAVNALHGLAELLTANVLTSHGVPASSVHFVVVPFPAMGVALIVHRVDAAFMTEPFLSAVEVGHGVVPVSGIDQRAAQDVPIAGYVTTREWAAMYPRTAAAFARALSRGHQVAATSRATVEQATIRALHISRGTAGVMALGSCPLTTTASDLERAAVLMQDNGQLPWSVHTGVLVPGMFR